VASLACPVRRHEGQEAKRLKELEAENARLKKLVANQALDLDMLKEAASLIFSGVTGFQVPISSSGPHRPQFDKEVASSVTHRESMSTMGSAA
jgi:hypothetical protein